MVTRIDLNFISFIVFFHFKQENINFTRKTGLGSKTECTNRFCGEKYVEIVYFEYWVNFFGGHVKRSVMHRTFKMRNTLKINQSE